MFNLELSVKTSDYTSKKKDNLIKLIIKFGILLLSYVLLN